MSLIGVANTDRTLPSRVPAAVLWGGIALAFAILVVLLPLPADARVLTPDELARISSIKGSFTGLLTEIVQVSRRPDLSQSENDCINLLFGELMQTSEELRSYEYLMTMETELTDVGDDTPMKDVLRFAVNKAVDVLQAERKRLAQVSEQCPRNSNSSGKTQQAIGFVDGTVGILKSIQLRL